MAKKTKQQETQQQKEFNYFEFFKFQVLKEYYTKLFKGEKTDEIVVKIKYFDNNKSTWFFKNGAMKFVSWKTDVDTETGKMLTAVTIKDINLDAKAVSKASGKEFKVFSSIDISKAVKAAQKALAA